MGTERQEFSSQQTEKLIQSGSSAHGDVINLVCRVRVFRRGGEQVGLDDIRDVAKITARLTVTIYDYSVVAKHGRDPLGDDRRIGSIGVLARAKYVEIAQPDRAQSVAAAKHVGIKFIGSLGHCIG